MFNSGESLASFLRLNFSLKIQMASGWGFSAGFGRLFLQEY